MIARKLFMMLAVTVLFTVIGSSSFSLGMEEDIKGTVTKIDDGKITIKDFMGVERTIELKNPEALVEFRVGDKAEVKDGVLLTKEGGAGPAPPYPGPRY